MEFLLREHWLSFETKRPKKFAYVSDMHFVSGGVSGIQLIFGFGYLLSGFRVSRFQISGTNCLAVASGTASSF